MTHTPDLTIALMRSRMGFWVCDNSLGMCVTEAVNRLIGISNYKSISCTS